MARARGFEVAYSNEAFELWYILHFEYLQSGISRNEYKKKLTKYLDVKYKKNDLTMYERLLSKQSKAVQNAKSLLMYYGADHNPEKDNPSTTVHLLVQQLNQYSRK